MDDIDGDGYTDIVVAGSGGTNGTDSVVQIWEVGKSGEFTFKAADKDSEPSQVEDVVIGHFNSNNASKETSATNMKKVMVIGGGNDDTAAEDALYSVYYDDRSQKIRRPRFCSVKAHKPWLRPWGVQRLFVRGSLTPVWQRQSRRTMRC